ncbi:Uncharacterized protein Fot_13327 [Forsythia ovata]|uniref:Uncharacterized protein n=1 Tax=Forsythia ovata TaxID=205694 RepID=A0ABD1W353_9LAMI
MSKFINVHKARKISGNIWKKSLLMMKKKTGNADLKCSLLIAKLLVWSKTCWNKEEATQLCRGFGPPGVLRLDTLKLVSSSRLLDFMGACTVEYHENWGWNFVVGFCAVA